MKKVKFIPNVPCKYQDIIEKLDMQFILLHKLVDNKKYLKHYIKLRETNPEKYYILDNSAFELGESMDGKLLLKWADILNVDEIIIPDVYEDKNRTLGRMNSFLLQFGEIESKFKLMAVPQGENMEELFECLDLMLQDKRVNTIGLNKLWPRNVTVLQSVVAAAKREGKEVHMLGTRNLNDWGLFAHIEGIRSADSRVLAKMVTGAEDIWEENLNNIQITILKNLLTEFTTQR